MTEPRIPPASAPPDAGAPGAALPVAALLVNAFVWGVSWLPFRLLDAGGLHSLWATAWIYAFAALAILARAPSAPLLLARSGWLLLLALAAGVTNACFNWGVTIGEVVRVVLLFYLMPVWAVLLARLLLGEAITAGSLARAALAIGGAAVVLWRPGAGIPLPASPGDWLGLAGGAAFALTNVLLRRQAGDAAEARALAMFAGGIAVPALLALSLPGVPAPSVDAGIALMATATGALFLLANLALQYGAARLPSAVTAVVMLSEVVFAAASAVAFGDEALTVRTLAGGAMIVGASLLAVRISPRR